MRRPNIIPLRILVVDANADTAERLAAWLRRATPCKVYTAADGAEAIEVAIDTRPEAIVMDTGMPGVSGFDAAQVLRRLFSKGKPPRLIALSAPAGEEHRRQILAAGFDACLCKPVDPERLLELLAPRPARPHSLAA